MNLYNPLKRAYWFGQADTRPLSVFRIVFAALLLKVALFFLPLSHALYSDGGIVPRGALISELARTDRFSLMDALSTSWMAALFFLFWAVVAFLLMVGYRTRLMTVLSFLCILSVHERNIFVLNGADIVMRVLSFWLLFLPLGDYYSVDAILARMRRYRRSGDMADLRVSSEAQHTTFAFPWRMIQVQFALIYLFTGLLKVPSEQWWHGEALYNALQVQTLTLPTGDWLRDNAPFWAFRLLSRFTLFAENLFFWLVFLPFLQPFARLLGIVMVALLHIGIMVTMSIQDFSVVMFMGYLLLFDPRWVKNIDRWLRAKREPVTLPPPATPDDPSWLLLAVTTGEEIVVNEWSPNDLAADNAVRQTAMIDALGHLPLSRLWLWSVRYARIRNGLTRASRWLVCHSPLHALTVQPEPAAWNRHSRTRALGRIALVASLVLLQIGVIWTNLRTLKWNDELVVSTPVPDPLYSMVRYVGLWQTWFMFAPFPSDTDGFIIIPGVFEDGTTYDLRTGQPPATELLRTFIGPQLRWRKLEENLSRDADEPILRDWARSYCISYNVTENRPVGQRLATLQIIFRYRVSHPVGAPLNPLQDTVLWTHECLT